MPFIFCEEELSIQNFESGWQGRRYLSHDQQYIAPGHWPPGLILLPGTVRSSSIFGTSTLLKHLSSLLRSSYCCSCWQRQIRDNWQVRAHQIQNRKQGYRQRRNYTPDNNPTFPKRHVCNFQDTQQRNRVASTLASCLIIIPRFSTSKSLS